MNTLIRLIVNCPPEKLGKIYAYLYNYCHKDEPVRRDNIISLIDIAG